MVIDTSFIKGNPESDDLCREVAKASGGVCLLSFSRGKDALAAWLNLTRFFDHIIPFTCAGIPHVGFADEYLAYVERIFGTHIIRLQDGGLYGTIDALQYQYPHDEGWIDEAALPIYDAQDIADIIRNHLGYPRAWTAYGLNASDSIDRMITVRQCRGRYYGTRSFYPNFDWTHSQIMDVLKKSNIKLSNEYHIAARSFAGGLMPHNLMAVEKRAPELMQKLKYYYPLVEASLARAQWRNEKCLPPKKLKDAKGENAKKTGTGAKSESAKPGTESPSKTPHSGERNGRTGKKKSSARQTMK